MKKRLTLILCAVFSMLALSALELVKDGKLQMNGIVIRQNPTPSESKAAEELAYHLKKSTGTEIPVLTEKENLPQGPYIYLGDCAGNREVVQQIPYNQGLIVIRDGNIHIAGKDDDRDYRANNTSTGTLFAAYEFLEKFLGVRWLWPGEPGEVIPVHRNLTIDGLRLEVKPKVQSSLWRNVSGLNSGWTDDANRRKFYDDQSNWLKRHRFSCDTSFQLGHAFQDYYKRYGKDHPEYFSMLPDGVRGSNPYCWSKGDPNFISMCVTSPGLVQAIVDNWKSGKPRRKIINLNENDTAGECVCPDCLAADNSPEAPEARLARAKKKFDAKDGTWFDELGSLSDRYCKFYLDVQKEADKVDPNHRLMGLIYTNFSRPPSEKIKLNDRIILRFCPPYMYPWTADKVREYKEIFSGWAKTGAQLMFRPNFTLDGNYFPVQYQDVFYELYMFSTPNMVAVDMDSLTGHYAAQGLVNYVIATLNHDRETSLDGLKDTFFSAFGAGKPFVKEYFDYLTQVSMNAEFDLPGGRLPEGGILYLEFYKVADSVFTPAVMAKCRALLDAAADASALDPIAAGRVEFLKNGLKNVELTMAAQAEYRKHRAGAPIDAFAKAVRELDKFRESIENTNALNMGHIRALEDRHWPLRQSLRLIGTDTVELNGWKILFDPNNTGLKEKWHLPAFDISNARDINTNSHWAQQPIGQEWEKQHGIGYLGTAWYFNKLNNINVGDKKNAQMLFQAVDGTATIYLNGQEIHHRPYPYKGNSYSWKEPFTIEIPSGLLKPDNNFLAIRVEKHKGLGGIWRPVNIIYTE
jgi:hypothetical protein